MTVTISAVDVAHSAIGRARVAWVAFMILGSLNPCDAVHPTVALQLPDRARGEPWSRRGTGDLHPPSWEVGMKVRPSVSGLRRSRSVLALLAVAVVSLGIVLAVPQAADAATPLQITTTSIPPAVIATS